MEVVAHRPAISISISNHNPFNRAGGRTSNVRFKMKRSRPIAVAVVGSASMALYWSSSDLRTIPPKQKVDVQALHDRQETPVESLDTALERLKLELGEEESVISSNGREKRKYSADSVERNLDDGTLSLKGRVWHRDHNGLTDGRADPLSSMTIDASTLEILERSGRFETTELIDPKR